MPVAWARAFMPALSAVVPGRRDGAGDALRGVGTMSLTFFVRFEDFVDKPTEPGVPREGNVDVRRVLGGRAADTEAARGC